MEKSAVGWMVIDGARLKVSKLCQKKGGKIFRVNWVYYTGPEERLKQTADEGGPKVIVGFRRKTSHEETSIIKPKSRAAFSARQLFTGSLL